MTTSSTPSNNPKGASWRLTAAAALLLAGAVLPARAGLFDDDEARRRIDNIRQELAQQGKDNEARIAKLEEQIRNIGVVEVLQQIEELKQQMAQLRGQLEVLANDNQQLQKRQRDFYLDLDSRLKRLEPAGTQGSVPPAGAAPPAVADAAPPAASAPTAASFGPPPTDAVTPRVAGRDDQAREVKAYDAASNLFRRNDFASAIDAFRAFLRDYPDSQLAANAQYWIGISYANMKDYKQAMASQQELLARHPQSPKAPDALLAVAAIQAEQGESGAARNTLEDIIARYPSTEAAGKARTRLTALKR